MSNVAQKKKLAQLGGDGPGEVPKKKIVPKQGRLGSKALKNYDEWALTEGGGFQPAEPSNLKGFLLTQLWQEIEDTEDVVIIENPDSTTGGAKKKKASKRAEESDKESNASEVLAQSQKPHKRRHISSKRSSVYEPPSPKDGGSEEEMGNEDEMNRLLAERDDVAEQLAEMQRKMEGLEWAERARGYQATVEKCVVKFRMAVINDYGNKEESEELVDA